MMLVERATEDDLADVLGIERAHMGNLNRALFLEKVVAARQCLIAREGDKRMGFAIVDQSFFGRYFVSLLIVHPEERRRGVATALMSYIEKTCPAEKLFTSTNQSNLPMRGLCEALGFVRSGIVENLDEGDSELIYVKFLRDSR
jgi:ribosomal protein S18 acetylase RimI-like enzyme